MCFHWSCNFGIFKQNVNKQYYCSCGENHTEDTRKQKARPSMISGGNSLQNIIYLDFMKILELCAMQDPCWDTFCCYWSIQVELDNMECVKYCGRCPLVVWGRGSKNCAKRPCLKGNKDKACCSAGVKAFKK